ncbi:HlyD family secretion protein [Labrys monachus]|uniref:Multidrug resistance efflux pump n=1 Tax=Labrys monachus TaxID=217067 RepID=A0ABU0F9S0_9HYPH|nr:biotin/lipoyl-binding protein [Labrys monachus]MDQ0390884.1 multidrug resistance efflux pump [Labrys monachus]
MNANPAGRRLKVLSLLVLVGAAAIVVYRFQAEPKSSPPILGVAHQTEIRVSSETSARLVSFNVTAGQEVHKGDVLAVLSNPELEAALQEAKAAAASARADRANVDAGDRKEEVDIGAQNVVIAESNLTLAQQQQKRASALASRDFASEQQLDDSNASLAKAEANLSLVQAVYAQSKAGPTREERTIAQAKVALADTAIADLEAKLAKTTLVAPADGVAGILIAEPGEVISPGQPVMTLEIGHERWFTFTIREDRLAGITIGTPLELLTARGETLQTRVTELRPLGEFAVWRAARAVGDHDVNSFLVRADPTRGTPTVEAGMTVWIDRKKTVADGHKL